MIVFFSSFAKETSKALHEEAPYYKKLNIRLTVNSRFMRSEFLLSELEKNVITRRQKDLIQRCTS